MSAVVEIRQAMAGTPISSEWAKKAAATRKERRAQLSLPVPSSPPEDPDDDWPTTQAIGGADDE